MQCSKLNGGPPKRYIHATGPMTVTLFGGSWEAFADVIKYLEMRSSWTTRVGPKSNDRYPYKKQKRRHG